MRKTPSSSPPPNPPWRNLKFDIHKCEEVNSQNPKPKKQDISTLVKRGYFELD
jgi:hypothetical protein